jgi:FHA domain
MAKLVILNQGMTGRTFDLNVERTTVGRVEDNTFQIADASVSSHHAEIILRGSDVVIKDIGSTNGTFIGGEKITETVLKPGQILKFGQVELRIDDGSPVVASPAPASAPASAPAPTSGKRQTDATMVIPRGVSLSDLEQGGTRPAGFNTNTAFSKKKNKGNLYFIIGGAVVALVILVLIIVLINKASGNSH